MLISLQPWLQAWVAAGILPSSSVECTLHRPLHDPGHDASVGLPAEMEAEARAENFIAAGLASLGIEADEVELAVASAAHELFWPEILDLLALDIGAVEPEPGVDLTRAPAS
jgi:hypothetical protein